MNYIKNKIQASWEWIKIRSKKFWGFIVTATAGLVLTASLVPVGIPPLSPVQPPDFVCQPECAFESLDWRRPNSDAQWANATKDEGLNFRFDYQLQDMKVSHERKVPLHEANYDKITTCPDCIRWELQEDIERMFEDEGNPNTVEGKTLQEWIDGQFVEELAQKKWEYDKIRQVVELIDNEIRLRADGTVDRKDDQLRITPSTKREVVEQNKLRNQ